MANIFSNFGTKVGNAFTNLGQGGNLFNADPTKIAALSEEDRRRLKREGLERFANSLGVAAAIGSGDPQRMALAQNKIRQAKIDKEDAKQKANLQKIIQNSNLIPDSMKEVAMAFPEVALKNIFSQSGKSNTTLESYGIYNTDGTYMGAVNKGDTNKINEIKNNPNLVIGSLGSPKTQGNQSMNFYSITDGEGNRIKTMVNPTNEDIDNLNKSGYFVNKLPTATDRGKGFDSGKQITYKGWNDDDGLKSRYQATNTLIDTGSRLLKQLSENPNSILTAGDLAQYFERAKAEVGALGGRPENYTSHLKENQQTSIKDLARESAVSESMLLDFTFQIAQARGQTGRGLSDKDFVIFQKIISAGLTADQKAAALTSFIDGITAEINTDLNSDYNFYNKRLERDANDKEAQTFVTGIEDLRSMPFQKVINPFAPTNTSQSEIDRLVQQYGN